MQPIAIFGGTFDPIHNGHIKTSLNIQAYFKFASYFFLPCNVPVIKAPALATNEQRIKMIELAIEKYPEFRLDHREIERASPSYMVDTLTSFREEFPQESITLIMGYDAFLSLPQWHKWEKLIQLANILVIERKEIPKTSQLPPVLQTLLSQHQKPDKEAILKKKAGTIFFFNAGHYDISSTGIRDEIKRKADVSSELPSAVYEYIKEFGLY